MMVRTLICLFVFLAIILGTAGCIQQNGTSSELQSQMNHSSADDLSSEEKSEIKTPRDTSDDSEKTYFNVRIVPATELERLQKEMGSDDTLVKNDKGYVIGLLSSDGLIIRGDLTQLERGFGTAGKDFDKDDVILHLLDITFGLDNSKIGLFKSDKKYKFWFDGYYSDAEVKYVKNLSAFFNTVSGTTQFEDEEVALGFLQTNYEVIPNNFYKIQIITEKMLKELYDDRDADEHLIKDQQGRLIGMVDSDHLCLVKTLSEEEQKYYILKGLLYSMGLHGISYQNKESFFYRHEGLNRNLSELDIEAIRLLYGGGLKSGNSLEDAKKTLGIPV